MPYKPGLRDSWIDDGPGVDCSSSTSMSSFELWGCWRILRRLQVVSSSSTFALARRLPRVGLESNRESFVIVESGALEGEDFGDDIMER